jgi:hypothetical protein
MIFSEMRGMKTFNIAVDERIPCLDGLFNKGEYVPRDRDDATTKNMVDRYLDIVNTFPDEIGGEAFPFFVDWLKYNVIMVEIIAYSNENAYTVFETMNDRGLNLSPSDMLKGFILSRFNDEKLRMKSNEEWKRKIVELRKYDKDEDQRFLKSWLRAKYAQTIRATKTGSTNEDFEKIGTRFHSWVRDNLEKVGLDTQNPSTFESFINTDFSFFFEAYKLILKAEASIAPGLEHVYYIDRWGIAKTLSLPLMLAPLRVTDDNDTVTAKIDMVARYIETFCVRRSVNRRSFGSSSIQYTMNNLIKEIRNLDLEELQKNLSSKITDMKETFDGMDTFSLHGQNKRFIKFLLSRLTSWLEQQAGMSSSFIQYYDPNVGKKFEVEHIWANKYERHKHEFVQEHKFSDFRNRIGALVLLPRGTNQSYGSLGYQEKLNHYIKENLLVKSLCSLSYENNPNFTRIIDGLGLPLMPHMEFNKKDVFCRQLLYKAMCERIWSESLG